MDGDLRTLIERIIERRFPNLRDRCPFRYDEAISMMIDIAEGMQDLHGCDLIHGDLKASNILVYLYGLGGRNGQDGRGPLFFRPKIGDFDSTDGVVGTAFWRAPEVLQALRNGCKPMLSAAADVYGYGMVCYELLTACIPFEESAKSNYDIILSGQRPELPAYLNQTMKDLLQACWRANSQDRPGWVWIIETLKEQKNWWLSKNEPLQTRSPYNLLISTRLWNVENSS
jgi:serine/threonine protein kinase